MSTKVFVKVLRVDPTLDAYGANGDFEEWIEISAVTLQDAEEEALNMSGVINILKSQYEAPTC